MILRMIDFSKKIDMINPVIISYFDDIFSDLLYVILYVIDVIARLVVVKRDFTCSLNMRHIAL